MRGYKRDQDRINPGLKNKKGTYQSFSYWLAWMLLIALFFIFILIFGENGLIKIGELRKLDMKLSLEINELIRDNEAIRREIRGLQEDPFFIEKVAREELDLVRPGEVVYHFVSTKNNNDPEINK